MCWCDRNIYSSGSLCFKLFGSTACTVSLCLAFDFGCTAVFIQLPGPVHDHYTCELSQFSLHWLSILVCLKKNGDGFLQRALAKCLWCWWEDHRKGVPRVSATTALQVCTFSVRKADASLALLKLLKRSESRAAVCMCTPDLYEGVYQWE